MIFSDKFSLYTVVPVTVLRCDVCHAREGFADVFAWDNDEDMNLAGLISHAQAHWSKIHTVTEAAQ